MSLFAISSGGGGSTASSSTGSNKQNKNDFPKRSSVKLLASRFAEAISGEKQLNSCLLRFKAIKTLKKSPDNKVVFNKSFILSEL